MPAVGGQHADNNVDSYSLVFGAISDVQYADIEDKVTTHTLKKRYYRNSLNHVRTAVAEWNTFGASFVLQLGDLIDGHCKHSAESCLNQALDSFAALQGTVHHTLGNHELYNFKHHDVCKKLFDGEDNSIGYHSFSPISPIRVISLDCYDISLLGRFDTSPEYRQAKEALAVNPNRDQNSPTGLSPENRRFLSYNGGISADQLQWLGEQLKAAEACSQQVIMFGHISLLQAVSTPESLLWNYADVLDLIKSHTCVKLYFSGHTHSFCSAVAPDGVTHICLPGVVETAPEGKCWATVFVSKSGNIEVKVYENDKEHLIKVFST